MKFAKMIAKCKTEKFTEILAKYKTDLKRGHILLLVLLLVGVCWRVFSNGAAKKALEDNPRPTYMVYHGKLDENMIQQAKQYDIVILQPRMGLTREQVARIQAAGTRVLGYVSIGEDLRTKGMTPEEMLRDSRFTRDGAGPRVDPRAKGDTSLDGIERLGEASPAGGGYASYYLDDNDHDGKPDFNPSFGCAYTNIGDPAWYNELDVMKIDGEAGVSGFREILTTTFGRGLGCDGVFLDTIDTCAPNWYTKDADPGRTRFEWTAPGVAQFMKRLTDEFPNKYVVQNRGLFFYNYRLPHFDYRPGEYIDFLFFESYMLDSSTGSLYSDYAFADNKNVYAPKIIAEANRRDGFKVLSLGYAEGPEEYYLKDALMGNGGPGVSILMEDIHQAQDEAGFSHYITDGSMLLNNDFVLTRAEEKDDQPPVWSSVHNDLPYESPVPRVGIGEVVPVEKGIIVRWDVAIDKNGVDYTLYYQTKPFDFAADPDLKKAKKLKLTPDVGEGYGYDAWGAWPNQAVIVGLDPRETYYVLIRAKDRSPAANEEKNTVMLEAIPLP